jgi:adenylylsulfate kinase
MRVNNSVCGGELLGPTSSTPARQHTGFVLWLTGLPGAGKTTIALALQTELQRRDVIVDHLDGDAVRSELSQDLGYSREDRDLNVRRIGWVSSRLARSGVVVIVSVVSPYRQARAAVQELIEETATFIEVHVATPLAECVRRDPKGLYAAAFAGSIENLTGVSAPYEEPLCPDLRISTAGQTVVDSASILLELLEGRGLIGR